jgi:phosphoribosylanthranilate isomerase
MVKVKICGIKNQEDALCAIEYGASALGFIFYRQSDRYVPPVKASNIVKDLPPFVDRVGVFVDMNLQGIINIIRRVGLSAIQLHGHESHEFCYELKCVTSIPVIKAFRVHNEESLDRIQKYLYCINAIHLDTYSKDLMGGTGKTFNWDLALRVKKYDKPIILSGGLSPDNVIQAYQHVRPYALDVNSGVEVSPGMKDHTKIKLLFSKLSTMDFND